MILDPLRPADAVRLAAAPAVGTYEVSYDILRGYEAGRTAELEQAEVARSLPSCRGEPDSHAEGAC